MLRSDRFIQCPPEHDAAFADPETFSSWLDAAKLHEIAKMNLPSIGQHLFHVLSFGLDCLQNLHGFIPSCLPHSPCEASQADGILKALGIGTGVWASPKHSANGPLSATSVLPGNESIFGIQVAPYLPNWMPRRIAPMAWLVQQAPRAWCADMRRP